MTTSRIAESESRLRTAFVATLVAITFVVGFGTGFVLSQIVAVHPVSAVPISSVPKAGADMSSAAYAAQHPNFPADMSAAAYAAMRGR